MIPDMCKRTVRSYFSATQFVYPTHSFIRFFSRSNLLMDTNNPQYILAATRQPVISVEECRTILVLPAFFLHIKQTDRYLLVDRGAGASV